MFTVNDNRPRYAYDGTYEYVLSNGVYYVAPVGTLDYQPIQPGDLPLMLDWELLNDETADVVLPAIKSLPQ